MPQRNLAEIVAGAVVLLVAFGFLVYALTVTATGASGGYTLHARFNSIDGLIKGADVRLAGVKVGSVTAETLDPQSFQADVAFTVADAVKLPKDSSAAIVSEGLLGGKYITLDPGGDPATIPPGGTITITQGSVSIEQLVGKYIFGGAGGGSSAPGAAQGGGEGGGQGGGLGPKGAFGQGSGKPGGGL